MNLKDVQEQEASPLTVSIVSFIIATALFSFFYIKLNVVWMVFLFLGGIGWFGLPKGEEGAVHRQRYIVFIGALAASAVIGLLATG